MRHLEHIKEEDINTAFIPMHQRPRTSTGYEGGESVVYNDSWDPDVQDRDRDDSRSRSFRDSSRKFFRVPPASSSSFYGQQSQSQSFLGFSNLLRRGRDDSPGSGKSRPPTALADTHPRTLPPLAAIFATIPHPSTQQFPIPLQSTQHIFPLPGVATFARRPGTAPASYFSSKPAYNGGPGLVHQPELSPPVRGRRSELAAAGAMATAYQLNAFEAADSPPVTAGSFAFHSPPREQNSGVPGSSEYGTESRPQSRRLTVLELCNDADADNTAAAAYQLKAFDSAVDSPSSATAGFFDSPFAFHAPPREPNSGIPRSSEYEYRAELRPQSRHLTVLELCNGAEADGGVRAFLPSAVGTASRPATSSGLVSSPSALALVNRTSLAGQALPPRVPPTAVPATSETGPTAFAEKGAVVQAYQTISSVHSDLETAQRDKFDLQSALDTQEPEGAVVRANQTISKREPAMKTVREEVEILKVGYDSKVSRFHGDTSDLQSALDAQKEAVAKANQTISNLRSLLKAARRNSEAHLAKKRTESVTLKVDYDTKVSRLQRENSDLRSALDALQREVAEDKLRLSLGIGDFKRWMRESSINTDAIISNPVLLTSSSDVHHVLAYNALLNVRSEKWSSAYEDAEKSIVARPSAMGYIVKALAQIGQGKADVAMQVFDLVFGNCNPNESNLLLLIKTITLFVAGKHDTAISRVHDLIAVSMDDETTYCYIQVLRKMYLAHGDHARAVQSLERGQGLVSSCTGSDLKTISFIFGWSFDGLQITVQRYHCEDLSASGREVEAAEALLKITDTFAEEIRASKVTEEWVMNLKTKCTNKLEELGDTAFNSGEHDNAIVQYTSALSLDPSNRIDILVKRSKARASKELWKDALMDAEEVIDRNPSLPLGYERKHAALHGAEDYDEAYNAFLHMLSIIEKSPDGEIRRLRDTYAAPRKTIATIETAIHETLGLCPLVLVDLMTGRLCNAQERVQMFKSEPPFKKLVSETAITRIDRAYIRQSVAKYFKWIMFSHTWEGREPTFKDVNVVDSVWKLDDSPLNEKLRQFCTIASKDGYRWAWSDTCCIDKDTSAILSQSLIAMYTWYEEAAETLVYLADVPSSAELGDLALTNSRWMTRAWTLQELLASKVVRFYNRDWKFYLNDMHTNHKESPEIKQELAKAMVVAPETVTSFQLEDLGVREKLRLASTRNATVEEDIAYSLIGIFSSNVVPRYGLGKTALGELLENIIARTGDVTVIAWTGQPLPYNSALPASLTVYGQAPYSPPPMEDNELDTCVEQLRTPSSSQAALAFYYRVAQLPRATFSNRCLHLPCIMFNVTKLGVQELGGTQGNLYRATVSSLGRVVFRTMDVIPLTKPRKLVFVHPWLRDICDPPDGFMSDDELEADSDVDSNDEPAAKSDVGSGDDSDASAPASPLHAEPSARVDPSTQALKLIARLGRPFNTLLLEQQSKGQYKRVATEHEIIVPGVPYQTNANDIKVKVLEVI